MLISSWWRVVVHNIPAGNNNKQQKKFSFSLYTLHLGERDRGKNVYKCMCWSMTENIWQLVIFTHWSTQINWFCLLRKEAASNCCIWSRGLIQNGLTWFTVDTAISNSGTSSSSFPRHDRHEKLQLFKNQEENLDSNFVNSSHWKKNSTNKAEKMLLEANPPPTYLDMSKYPHRWVTQLSVKQSRRLSRIEEDDVSFALEKNVSVFYSFKCHCHKTQHIWSKWHLQ